MVHIEAVPESIDFPKEEENTLKFWQEIDAFSECVIRSKNKPKFTFYDGPPFATGLPHYGHILAGTIKDIVTRYAYQSGYRVDRRFGWDCHGLPVEFEIDKALDIKGPEDVERMGIAAYNAECRKIVTRYADEWERIVTRLGRWIDFKNDYKTMYPWYMESIWWVFSELWNKGLVYKGVKVMPYSTACSTPLSNFESGQNYKEVVDPAVVVTFPIVDAPFQSVQLLAWTTTPWTLPSNLAVCVNPTLLYILIEHVKTGKHYILMKCRLSIAFKCSDDVKILETFPGEHLKGLRYVPIFDYFSDMYGKAFIILNDGYVNEESGTGVVHLAPYFGEDDYRVCLANGVVTRDQEIVCPVDAKGCFTSPVKDFQGRYVKDADKDIIKHLKNNNRLLQVGTVKHSYPFCWRSETPLIYKAVPSWFVRVEAYKEALVEKNKNTRWVPDFVKEKRFGNWLKDARDWAVSRNRYWGTPIPLWMSSDGEEIVCVSSIRELEALSGVPVTDLHRENIDHILIPSRHPGKPPLKRISEVFDCWFESGSMPYAQVHYPFENEYEFRDKFPADFIAEGIDQTRGWFYTLLVVSTLLFDQPPFKNLIANGLVLASDGQKMSKRKKNYPDPMEVVGKFGADALRLYLINSPVVRAENLRFKEEGVRDILKDVFLPWYNAYRFLVQNILTMEKATGENFHLEETPPTNIMDCWITSFTSSLLAFIRDEMMAYRLYTVVPKLVKFVDNLTNWYVRLNRRRCRGSEGIQQQRESLTTLGNVLTTMVKMMAPFTPFLCEYMYQNLKRLGASNDESSVHFHKVPQSRLCLVNKGIEESVGKMQAIIDLGRVARDRQTLPLKQPLRELIVIHHEKGYFNDVEQLCDYIKEELNVRSICFTDDFDNYGVALRAEPDFKALGMKFKSKLKSITQATKALTDESVRTFMKTGMITIEGETLLKEDLRVMFACGKDFEEKYARSSDGNILILLNVILDEELKKEGMAREISNRIQKLKKTARLVPTDEVAIQYEISPENGDFHNLVKAYENYISTHVNSKLCIEKPFGCQEIIKEEFKWEEAVLRVTLFKVLSGEKKNLNSE